MRLADRFAQHVTLWISMLLYAVINDEQPLLQCVFVLQLLLSALCARSASWAN